MTARFLHRKNAVLSGSPRRHCSFGGRESVDWNSDLQVEGQDDSRICAQGFVKADWRRNLQDRYVGSGRTPQRSPRSRANRQAIERLDDKLSSNGGRKGLLRAEATP